MADSKPGVHVLQLKHVSVPKLLMVGEKFLKWDEVSSRSQFPLPPSVPHLPVLPFADRLINSYSRHLES